MKSLFNIIINIIFLVRTWYLRITEKYFSDNAFSSYYKMTSFTSTFYSFFSDAHFKRRLKVNL